MTSRIADEFAVAEDAVGKVELELEADAVDLGLDAGLAAFLMAASCVICVALLCAARRLCRMCRRRGYGSVDADELLDDDVWADDDDDDGDDDDMQAASIRVQVVLDDDAAEGDGVEEFDLELAGLRTVADVKGAMAAMYADDGAAERALARRMVVQCLDDERGLLVALPGRTPVAQLRGADHLLVSLRGGGAPGRAFGGGGGGDEEAPSAISKSLAQRKAALLSRTEYRKERGERGGVVVRACDGGGAEYRGGSDGGGSGGGGGGARLPRRVQDAIRTNKEAARQRAGPAAGTELERKMAARRELAEGLCGSGGGGGRSRPPPPPSRRQAADDGAAVDTAPLRKPGEATAVGFLKGAPLPPARAPHIPPPPPPPPPAAAAAPPTLKKGAASGGGGGGGGDSFLGSPEFLQKLERRKTLVEESAATEVMADNRSGASGSDAGAAMSYLEELAARIAAKK